MTIKNIFLAATLLSFGFAGTAEAHPGKHTSTPDYRPAAVALAAGPMKLKKQKRQKRVKAKRAKRLAKFDTNKDGKLDNGERVAKRKQRFAKLDANGDSKLTMEELKAFKQARKLAKSNRMARKGKRVDHRRGNGKAKGINKRFARLDRNNDGAISWQEFNQGKKRNKKMRKQNRNRKRNRGVRVRDHRS